ncbi:ATP/GTP-binding protein [Herpetosiphon sp. NSE202]|uniref:GTP-binding protein n=1 Tax=Herpetosiphon sp. NSE202 TaxID=3351349 RepID=UPI00363AF751
MEPFKLVITGAFNTGKSTFIRSLSDINAVNTDKATSSPDEQRIKANTTVAMDYGRVRLDDYTLQLFGTPGQTRFDFMRDILAKNMDGFLVLVDLSQPATIDDAATILAQFRDHGEVPYAVVANKSDLNTVISQAELRQQLNLSPEIHIYLCTATDKNSVREVVRRFLRDAHK